MRIHSCTVAGLLSILPLALLCPLQAQPVVPDPLKIEVIDEKNVPLVLPETTADPVGTAPVIAPPPEKLPNPPKKVDPKKVDPVTPPAAAPAITSATTTPACSTCGTTSCCGHPLLLKLFHPFHCRCHKKIFHCCWHFHLFHRFHSCGGCCGSEPYSGAVVSGVQPPVNYGGYAMGSMYAPYGYAYYPYSNVTVPMYPGVSPTQLAARAPETTPVTQENLEAWKALPTNTLYGKALSSYWDKDYRAALEMFWILVASNPQDSRFWYFKALTERSLGDAIAAKASAQRGAALEYLDADQAKVVNNVLERVQGQDRDFLRVPGLEITSVSAAQTIVSRPIPKRDTLVALDNQIIQTKK